MQGERPRLGFICVYDPMDHTKTSGVPAAMYQALGEHFEMVPLLVSGRPLWLKLLQGAYESILWIASGGGGRFNKAYSVLRCWYYARKFGRLIRRENPRYLFVPFGSPYMARLRTDVPIICNTDMTFKLMERDYYPAWENLCPASVRQGNRVERWAMHRADRLIFPSEWVCRSAVEDYGADPAKARVVRWGASLTVTPTREEALARDNSGECHLLMLGVAWGRKGGAIAFEAFEELLRRGVDCRLTVCGCVPPPEFAHPRMEVIPFLNKNSEQDRVRFHELMLSTHFLVLPTRAECYGVVFCEASAYGIPSLATDTGGVSSAIEEGENGFLFPPEARGAAYADRIESVWRGGGYAELVRSSRDRYERLLNWPAWAEEVAEAIKST